MKNETLFKRLLRELYHYLLFFSLTAFLVTCTMSLFISTLSNDLNLKFTEENLNRAAKLTFLCVILLSILFTMIDIIRRKLTTERITRHITAAAKQIVQGNFDIRISPVARLTTDDNYNEIIHCFNRMAEELQSVETLRTDFIANVSHELKTPLAVMQNYGTLLQSPELPDEKRLSYAKGITDNSRRMADMITNILKLNRLENQTIFPQATDFDLGELLCECLLQYESIWESSDIEIRTDIAEDIRIHADSELLSLVFNNLLSNAFKFTDAGGCVAVSLTADKDHATVTVSDTGCGMSAETGAHIFEKFYQGDSSHATKGNGLGLALVKRVMDILHGEISVESTVGAGSAFTVRIRRA